MNLEYDVNNVRGQFPVLESKINGKKIAVLDGPGGTQVPVRVVENDYGLPLITTTRTSMARTKLPVKPMSSPKKPVRYMLAFSDVLLTNSRVVPRILNTSAV